MINPYLNRGMLRDEGDFFGREEEIHNIYMRITHKTPQSCSVVGPRKIGKSSLLYHLSKKRGRFANYLPPDQDDLYCVFYDLQPERSITTQRFFGKLRHKTMQALEDSASALLVEDECEEEAFEMLVEQASEKGYSLIFFFDEFESVTQNQNFDEQFFSQLRHIAYTYNVAFVTSSQADLSRLCHTDAIAQSPFFNIFTKVNLQLLKENEAIALIRKPAEAHGVHIADREIELVFELAGCHPFLIQAACTYLFEFRTSRRQDIPRADFDYVREQFLIEALDHYKYWLRHLDDRERSALRAVATSSCFDAVASRMEVEVETLRRKGLIVRRSGRFSPFSRSFQDFLQGLPAVSITDSGGVDSGTADAQGPGTGPDPGEYDAQVWDLIISLEKRLRTLLEQRLESRWGTKWEQQLEKRYTDMYQGWLDKRQKDARTFRLYERTTTILEYAYLDELCKVIEDDWQFFREIFEFKLGPSKENKKILHQKIQEIVRVRNPLAHGRTVPDTEIRRAHVSCDDLNNQIEMLGRQTRQP